MDYEKAKKLVQYTMNMHEHHEHYGVSPIEALEDLEKKDSDSAEKLEEIYKKVHAKRVCFDCGNQKFYDQSEDEYYCPVHDI